MSFHRRYSTSVTLKTGTAVFPDAKVLSLEALTEVVRLLRSRGSKIVLCHGVFDLLHPGHIRYLEAAKREGNVLVVTVTPDRYVNKGPGRPVFPEQLRAESLAALNAVDYVAVNEWPDAAETIRLLRPHVYAKGSEYEVPENDVTGKILVEEAVVREVGGRVHFTHEISFSSSTLLNSYFPTLSPETQDYLARFRRNYSSQDIVGKLQALQKMRVLVVGDSIIDEYHVCKSLGRASKTTAINARFLEAESYPGGALAIANHVAGFCQDVHVVSMVGGVQSYLPFIQSHLKPNITTKFFPCPDRPTTVKRRFVDVFRYQKMFAVTFIDDRPLPPAVAGPLCQYLAEQLPSYDLVIAADFGHSVMAPEVIDVVCNKARFLAVNTQINSTNMGYNPIMKYPRAEYVCLDQDELRTSYHDRFGPLEHLIERVGDDLHAAIVTVTRGDRGSITYQPGDVPLETPVFSTEVVDTIGAGDAYFGVTAPCAAAGFPPELVGFVGNAAGALAIRIVGNRESINPMSLYKYITTLLK